MTVNVQQLTAPARNWRFSAPQIPHMRDGKIRHHGQARRPCVQP